MDLLFIRPRQRSRKREKLIVCIYSHEANAVRATFCNSHEGKSERGKIGMVIHYP